jgi:peptidoglycan/xylan/chitin deacetylase (PgdA/CDA1 family)
MKKTAILLLAALSPVWSYQTGKFYHDGNTKEKVIALTFDDGPGRFTPPVLELLKKHHIHATFYMEGSQIEGYPAIARMVRDAGHEIGNHTYNHFNFNTPKNAFKERYVHELVQTETSLKRALNDPNYTMKSMRMPYGAFGKYNRAWLLPTLKEHGYALVHWSFGEDWILKIPEDKMVNDYVTHAKPGAVFLFHDGGRHREKSLAVVTRVVEILEAKGYKFIAAEDMFKD